MIESTILLIDNDSDLLQAIAHRCRAMGLLVEQTRYLPTATNLIDKIVPDVVCVDVNLPTGNGLRFCEMLAADLKTACVPIIVLSGQQTPDTLESCRRFGFQYIANKHDVWTALEPLLQKLLAEPRPARAFTANDIRPRLQSNNLIPHLPQDASADAGSAPAGARSTKQIVVADDDCDLVSFLSQRFRSLGCSVIGANSALEAINVIHRMSPDLVVLDVNMPGGNGLSVSEMMATDERLRATPVIILTGRSDEHTIRRCHDMHLFYVQKGSTIWQRIEPLVCELLHLQLPDGPSNELPTPAEMAADAPSKTAPSDDALMDSVFAMLGSAGEVAPAVADAAEHAAEDTASAVVADPPWVLCIDDECNFSDALKVRFEQHGMAVVRAYNGMEGYRLAFTSPASAIVLDYNMPNGQGDYILDRLKSNPVTRDIPVFIVTGMKDKILERRMMAMGAAGFLNKPVNFEALRAQLAAYIDILATPAPAFDEAISR